MSTTTPADTIVDASHPWLGLEAFTRHTQAYFFGRNDEIRDIFLRVREHPLTVLFGQSGLGKSSLLGAGLVPKLEVEGYRTATVLFGFDGDAPPLIDQIRNALATVCDTSDAWHPTDSLWEIFHHKGRRCESWTSRPPVLILDQFEEVFTLGQQNPARAKEVELLFHQLAELIENAPPASLTEQFAKDRSLAPQFDFGPSPVRIVLTLREDYLSQLERWKNRLPSLMRNRMALHLLRGPQALEAVVRPGRMEGNNLVSDEVGANIVRFVAKAEPHTPLTEIDAVPPLLSLVCAELNSARLDTHPPGSAITADLVEAQSQDILQDFYNRSFDRFPAALREFVEDRMITIGGHRNPVAREDAIDELTRAGVPDPSAAIDKLVKQRLLSSESRGGIQRLELTHDVLTPLAVRSRDERNEIRARAERDKQAEIQRAKRERIILRRTLTALSILSIAAVGGAILGFQGRQQARDEAIIAIQKGEEAEKERAKAEEERAKALTAYRDGQITTIKRFYKPPIANILQNHRGYVEATLLRESALEAEEASGISSNPLANETAFYLDEADSDDSPLYPALGLSRIKPLGQINLNNVPGSLVPWPSGPGLWVVDDSAHGVAASYVFLGDSGPASMTNSDFPDDWGSWRLSEGGQVVRSAARSLDQQQLLLTDLFGQTHLWKVSDGARQDTTNLPAVTASSSHPQSNDSLLLALEAGGLAQINLNSGLPELEFETPPPPDPSDQGDPSTRIPATRSFHVGSFPSPFPGGYEESENVKGLVFSADGNSLYLTSGGKVSVHSLPNNTTGKISLNTEKSISKIVFSPEATRMASLHDQSVTLWKSDGTLQDSLPVGNVMDFGFSHAANRFLLLKPDGLHSIDLTRSAKSTTHASLSQDASQNIVKEEQTLLLKTNLPDATALVLAPHQPFAALLDDDLQKFEIWNLEKRSLLNTLALSEQHFVGFTPDGTTFLTGDDSGTLLHFWNLTAPAPHKSAESGHARIELFASSTERYFATVSRDWTLRLWDEQSKLPIRTLGFDEETHALCFSPDGKSLAVTTSSTIHLFELSKLLEPAPPLFQILSPSPDGSELIAADQWGRLHQWEIASGKLTAQGHHSTAPVTVLLRHPHEQILLVGNSAGTLSELSLQDSWPILRTTNIPAGIESAAYSPDGSRILLGTRSGSALLLSREDTLPVLHEVLASPPKLEKAVREDAPEWLADTIALVTVAFSPDGQSYYTATPGELLAKWSAVDGHPLVPPTQIPINAWGLFPLDQQELAVAGLGDGSDKIGFIRFSETEDSWTRTSRDDPATPFHLPETTALAFAPVNKLLAFGSSQEIALADLTFDSWLPAHGLPRTLPLTIKTDEDGDSPDLAHLAFSNLEDLLAAAFADGRVILWQNVRSNSPTVRWDRQLFNDDGRSGAWGSRITQLAFLNGGSLLACGDDSIALFDARSGDPIEAELFAPLATAPLGWRYLSALKEDDEPLFLENDSDTPSEQSIIPAERINIPSPLPTSAALSSDGQLALLGSPSGRLSLVSQNSGLIESFPSSQEEEVSATTFLHDHRFAVTAVGNILQFWKILPEPRPLLASHETARELARRWGLQVTESLKVGSGPLHAPSSLPPLEFDLAAWNRIKLEHALSEAYMLSPNPDFATLRATLLAIAEADKEPHEEEEEDDLSALHTLLSTTSDPAQFDSWLDQIKALPPRYRWAALNIQGPALLPALPEWQQGKLEFEMAKLIQERLLANQNPPEEADRDPFTGNLLGPLSEYLSPPWKEEVQRAIARLGNVVHKGGTDKPLIERDLSALLLLPGAAEIRDTLADRPARDEIRSELEDAANDEERTLALQNFQTLEDLHIAMECFTYLYAARDARYLKRYELAAQFTDRALELATSDNETMNVHIQQAYLADAQADRKKALEYATKATDADPASAYAWTERARFEDSMQDGTKKPDPDKIRTLIASYAPVAGNKDIDDRSAILLLLVKWHLLLDTGEAETQAKALALEALRENTSPENFNKFWSAWSSVTPEGKVWAAGLLQKTITETRGESPDEDTIKLYKNLCDYYSREYHLRQAIATMETSLADLDLDDDEDLGWFLTEIGEAYRKFGDLNRALRYFESGMPLEEDSSWSQEKQALALIATKQESSITTGLTMLRNLAAKQQASGDFDSYFRTYATLLAQHGDPDQAIKILDTAIKTKPKDPQFPLALGKIHLRLAADRDKDSPGQKAAMAAARTHLEGARKLFTSPDEFTAIAILLNDPEQARKQWNLHRKMWPTDDYASLLIAACLAVLENDPADPDLPERLLAKAVSLEFYNLHDLESDFFYAELRKRPKVIALLQLLPFPSGENPYQTRDLALATWAASLSAPEGPKSENHQKTIAAIKAHEPFEGDHSSDNSTQQSWEELAETLELPERQLRQLNGVTMQADTPPGTTVILPATPAP